MQYFYTSPFLPKDLKVLFDLQDRCVVLDNHYLEKVFRSLCYLGETKAFIKCYKIRH